MDDTRKQLPLITDGYDGEPDDPDTEPAVEEQKPTAEKRDYFIPSTPTGTKSFVHKHLLYYVPRSYSFTDTICAIQLGHCLPAARVDEEGNCYRVEGEDLCNPVETPVRKKADPETWLPKKPKFIQREQPEQVEQAGTRFQAIQLDPRLPINDYPRSTNPCKDQSFTYRVYEENTDNQF